MPGIGLVLAVPALFLVAFVVVVVLVARSRARDRRRRGDDVLTWGARHGWAPADPAEARRLPCPPVRSGGSAHLVFRGPAADGAPSLAVDWSRWEHHSGVEVGSGSQTEIRHVILAAPLGGPPSSGVTLVRTSALGRRARRHAGREAVPTGHAGFDARFLVLPDGPGLPPVITRPLVEWLGRDPGVGDLAVRIEDGWMTCWCRGQLTVATLQTLLAFSVRMRAVVSGR